MNDTQAQQRLREARDAIREARSLVDGNPPNVENCQHALQGALTALALVLDAIDPPPQGPRWRTISGRRVFR